MVKTNTYLNSPQYGVMTQQNMDQIESELEIVCCLRKYDELMMREGMFSLGFSDLQCPFDDFEHNLLDELCCADTYLFNIGHFQTKWAIEHLKRPGMLDLDRSLLTHMGFHALVDSKQRADKNRIFWGNNFEREPVDLSKPLYDTVIKPLWPGKPYRLACPAGTAELHCRSLGNKADSLERGCQEPESETQEVLNSFLIHCGSCLYVDVGCNVGYFAAHAAMLGAKVECYEPLPNLVDAVKVTRQLNGVSAASWKIENVAITADDDTNGTLLTFRSGYSPCGLYDGRGDGISWNVPALSIRHVLIGKRVQLLKVDIDSNEGEIFHTVAEMITRNETFVQTILIEVGDSSSNLEWYCSNGDAGCKRPSAHPRGGNVNDFWMLQKKYGYYVYRLNIHVAREIYDWAGENVNKRMNPPRRGVWPMNHVRAMKKLEWVLPSISEDLYRDLFHEDVSFLLTRDKLAEITVHHGTDLRFAGLTPFDLNKYNPALDSLDEP